MNKNELKREPGLERIATGVPGLDEVLKGGFFEGAVYIVRGTPGAGKTILANQICFHQARQGKRALFVTLLAGTNVSAPTRTTVPASSVTTSGVCVGSVPAVIGTARFLASDPAMASTGMITQ